MMGHRRLSPAFDGHRVGSVRLASAAVGSSWERILSDYDPRQGGLMIMIMGMGVLLLAPLLAARGRNRAMPVTSRAT